MKNLANYQNKIENTLKYFYDLWKKNLDLD